MCERERERNRESEREEERKDEGIEHFVTFTKKNSNLPEWILREKRVVSPFGLYANLLAISYMLCVQYCDKWVVLFRHPFSLQAHVHVCVCARHVHVHTCEHTWIACFWSISSNESQNFLVRHNLAKYKLNDLSWPIHFFLQYTIEIIYTILLCVDIIIIILLCKYLNCVIK